MAVVNEDFIEEVRSRNDVVEVISGYIKLQRRGANYFGLCPFHGEKTASFSVSPGKQMYYCFGCHAGGNVINFVMEYENFGFMEAIGYLAQRVGMEVPKGELGEQARKEADHKARILEVNKDAANYYYLQLKGQGGQLARDYFARRQLTDETIRKFGLGYSLQYSDDLYKYLKQKGYNDELLRDSGLIQFDEQRGGHDKFWNRVMFPILDTNNHIVGFGGRVMGDGLPKYMNSPETKVFNKSRTLYGLNHARQSRRPNIILCEGYMDVISLHQAGFNNACASLGTALTPGHARLLSRYTKDVLLCYDSDKAGINAALRAIPILKEAGISAKIINMQPYKDPDEFIKNLGPEAFEERISTAKSSFMFEIAGMAREYELDNPEKKIEFVNAAASRVAQFPDSMERNIYAEAISREYNIQPDDLKKKINEIGYNEGIVSANRIKKPQGQKSIKPEEGMNRTQNLLLTWLIEDDNLYNSVKNYIGPEDFDGELYQEVAAIVFTQLAEGTANPARILSHFTESDKQQEVAVMFNGALFDDMSLSDKEKTLKETIVKMKQRAIQRKSEQNNDPNALMEIIREKKALQELEKLHIKIKG